MLSKIDEAIAHLESGSNSDSNSNSNSNSDTDSAPPLNPTEGPRFKGCGKAFYHSFPIILEGILLVLPGLAEVYFGTWDKYRLQSLFMFGSSIYFSISCKYIFATILIQGCGNTSCGVSSSGIQNPIDYCIPR